jgi:hypothetical protein
MRLSQGQLSMTVSANLGQLGQTRGLLGVFNNDASDDLTLRDGSVLPSNSSTEIIYSQFGESCTYNKVMVSCAPMSSSDT